MPNPLIRLLAYLPLWLLHALGWLGGWLAFLLSPDYRQRFLAHAAHAGYGFAQVRGAVGAAGQLLAELPRLWFGSPVAAEFLGTEHIDAALARGNGLIFLTPHMGCFEITPQAFARKYASSGQSITVLFRPPRKAWLAPLVNTARARPGLAAAPATLAGVKQMLKALKKGQAVGLLPDQVPPAGMGVLAPFFGREAYTMTMAAKLATQTGATVLLAWGKRLSWGRGYTVYVEPAPSALPTDAAAASAEINAWMELLIRRCPQQYLWAYARYKSAPLPAAAAQASVD